MGDSQEKGAADVKPAAEPAGCLKSPCTSPTEFGIFQWSVPLSARRTGNQQATRIFDLSAVRTNFSARASGRRPCPTTSSPHSGPYQIRGPRTRRKCVKWYQSLQELTHKQCPLSNQHAEYGNHARSRLPVNLILLHTSGDPDTERVNAERRISVEVSRTNSVGNTPIFLYSSGDAKDEEQL